MPASATQAPPRNGQRSVATLLQESDPTNEGKWAPRQCRQCSATFQPIRKDQDFCSGGACRRAWWQEHRAERAHNCRCGEEHNPDSSLPWPAATVGALFLRYADDVGLPLPSGVRAHLAGDTRPVVPDGGGRCQRQDCRGFLVAFSDDEELRCLLCCRGPEPIRNTPSLTRDGRLRMPPRMHAPTL